MIKENLGSSSINDSHYYYSFEVLQTGQRLQSYNFPVLLVFNLTVLINEENKMLIKENWNKRIDSNEGYQVHFYINIARRGEKMFSILQENRIIYLFWKKKRINIKIRKGTLY